ncbi:MAG TPA: hypothetical protein VNI52_11620 [Sphingobacteriaceae bacterium]|nr:hypothetical protein [Sphingobacteriaceae bacterium]
MLTYTQHTLEKIELLFKAMNYKIRYEKGNFKTGACVLENSRVIVVNKFSDLESKITALIELIKTIALDESLLDEKQLKFLYTFKQTTLEF